MSESSAVATSPLFTTPGAKLLGEVISWNTSGVSIRYIDVVDALRAAGLDPDRAKELCPRDAFSRACRKLSEARIIRKAKEDHRTITFQFTAERKDGERYEYELETMLVLDKETGKIECELAGLAILAQAELDKAIDNRTSNDITQITQRLFKEHADLFPIREQGGVYFVPHQHKDFLDKVHQFLGNLGGRMSRFPIAAGTSNGDRSAREAVTHGLDEAVAELSAAIADFSDSTRKGTIDKAAQRIREAKFKVEAYSEFLGVEKDRLLQSVAELSTQLKAKVEEITRPAPEPEPALV